MRHGRGNLWLCLILEPTQKRWSVKGLRIEKGELLDSACQCKRRKRNEVGGRGRRRELERRRVLAKNFFSFLKPPCLLMRAGLCKQEEPTVKSIVAAVESLISLSLLVHALNE